MKNEVKSRLDGEIVAKYLKMYAVIALGSIIFAVAFNWFYEPNQLAVGGLTGLAQVVNFLLPWAPVGVVTTILNIPLFIAGWKLIGRHLLVSSLFSVVVSSLVIDWLAVLYTFPPMDPMLACTVGGAMMGVGLGIVFSQGATTGGTDVVARLLGLKFPWLPMGKLVLIPEFFVLALVAVVFRNINSALYGLIGLFVSSMVMDKVLYGMDTSKVAYIISDHWQEVSSAILDMNRGVTILDGEGAYTHAERRVLLAAFKQKEIVEIKKIVHAADPNAFLIVCDAHDVLGEGFGEYKREDM